jgi:MFS family permease
MGHNRQFLTALAVTASYASVAEVLTFSLPLLAFDIRGEGTDLALISGAGFVPNVVFAVFVGVLNDRIRKALAFRSYVAIMAVATAVLATSLWQGLVSVPGLILFVILFNAAGYALSNAQLTLIRLTVPKDRLSEATALSSSVYSIITTAGPALGGLALVALGHAGLVAACAALLCLSFLATGLVNPAEALPPPRPFWPALKDGWATFRANHELVTMTVAIVLTNAAAGAFTVGLVLKLKTQTLADPFQIGLVLAAAGVGAALASVGAPRLRRRLGHRAAFFWPILALALLYLGFIPDWPVWALIGLSFVEGCIAIHIAIGVWSIRQETTEAAVMGRVAGITGAIFKIGMPPVIVLAGWLADLDHLPAVFILAALIKLAAVLYLARGARWGWPGPGV